MDVHVTPGSNPVFWQHPLDNFAAFDLCGNEQSRLRVAQLKLKYFGGARLTISPLLYLRGNGRSSLRVAQSTFRSFWDIIWVPLAGGNEQKHFGWAHVGDKNQDTRAFHIARIASGY